MAWWQWILAIWGGSVVLGTVFILLLWAFKPFYDFFVQEGR